MRTILVSSWMFVAVTSLALACGSGPVDTGSEGRGANSQSATGTTSEAVVSVTAVEVRPDGTSTAHTSYITRAQAESMQRARAASASYAQGGSTSQAPFIAVDTDSCDGYTTWLMDVQQNAQCTTTWNNLICFKGSGTATLSNYAVDGGTWQNYAYSYWPSNEGGPSGLGEDGYVTVAQCTYCNEYYDYFSPSGWCGNTTRPTHWSITLTD
jgi:hypothetical protein